MLSLSEFSSALRDLVFRQDESANRGPVRMESVDYDREGRLVLESVTKRLNLLESDLKQTQYSPVNVIWRTRTPSSLVADSFASVFVGDHRAAGNEKLLLSKGIKNIVNCTRPCGTFSAQLPNYLIDSPHQFNYFEFPIANWKDFGSARDGIADFFLKLFEFIEAALARGEGVLIHCLAGAHRAGTTGVSVLMYMADLSARDAIAVAKKCRPVIDPIGSLPGALQLLEKDLLAGRLAHLKAKYNTDGLSLSEAARGAAAPGGGLSRCSSKSSGLVPITGQQQGRGSGISTSGQPFAARLPPIARMDSSRSLSPSVGAGSGLSRQDSRLGPSPLSRSNSRLNSNSASNNTNSSSSSSSGSSSSGATFQRFLSPVRTNSIVSGERSPKISASTTATTAPASTSVGALSSLWSSSSPGPSSSTKKIASHSKP